MRMVNLLHDNLGRLTDITYCDVTTYNEMWYTFRKAAMNCHIDKRQWLTSLTQYVGHSYFITYSEE